MNCPRCEKNGVHRPGLRQSFEQGEWWCTDHGPYFRYPQPIPGESPYLPTGRRPVRLGERLMEGDERRWTR